MSAPDSAVPAAHPGVPRLADDYTAAAARRRLAFLAEATGVRPEHLGRYSFDPAVLAGNIENFVGVAQVPIGIAGPLPVDGEHARGTFYAPLATTEGTLVASYNRGMKLLYAAGGVRTTVMADVMQRMFRARQISKLGGLLAGVNNNGNHSANGIAALFAATGQDIANVAESSAALVHTEVPADGSYYYSITIPALIVATYGGRTGLPTQRECLELLGCYGPGRVRKLAEIVAATVLCGEVSLGAAVVADEWVTAHERLGRNRP